MKTFLLFITCAAVLVFGGTALATTIHVPADQPTIQAGIDAASDGDTVLVADGTYTGEGNINLDFGGKAIVVKSENGAENCIIDGENESETVGFNFNNGETTESVVNGFTITNCNCSFGAVITCYFSSSPTIINNIITGNYGTDCSGGIYCEDSSPNIINNIIKENGDLTDMGLMGFPDMGFGVVCYGNSMPIIKDNIISNNGPKSIGIGKIVSMKKEAICPGPMCVNRGISCGGGTSPIIIGNRIRDNSGGGIEILEASAVIKNNIITGNSASGGIYLEHDSSVVINNTIIGNSASGSPARGSSDLRCEYDNHNRIFECFIDWIEPSNYGGGGIHTQSSSAEIMNNIIAFSKRDKESLGLSRWYYTDLFMRYNREGPNLKSVTYYYGFENFGDSGDVHLSGGDIDTSFTIQSGERYWMETNSFVDEFANGGGIDLTICMDNDSLKLKVDVGGYFGGCYFLYNTNLQSYGVGMSGAGIMAIGDNSFPNIAYNDIYGNEEGNYLFGATSDSTYEVDLTGIDGNISQDPLCEPPDYFLSSGSPCIDAGNPEPAYNDSCRPPGMGTERCDMGAYGGPENDIITIVTSVKDYTAIPSQFLLYQNYPNPFNPTTIISYQIPKSSFVRLSIYDITGRFVETLVNEHINAGYYSVNWNASNVSSGIYIYRIDAGDFSSVNKCLIVK